MKLSLSANISKLRKEHAMTQEQLAEALGVTFASVSKWERGVATNLHMADACYPVFINPENEEIVRAAAKQVNTILGEYREKWGHLNLEPEKIIVMVAYQFSLEKLQLLQRNDTAPYTEKVKELTELLEDYFKKE